MANVRSKGFSFTTKSLFRNWIDAREKFAEGVRLCPAKENQSQPRTSCGVLTRLKGEKGDSLRAASPLSK